MPPDCEVLVAGGGLAGSSFACALAAGGVPCTVVEATGMQAGSAQRAISLTQSSRRILSGLGLWPDLKPNPIKRLHISDQGQFGVVRLAAADFGMEALGYLVEAGDLHRVLHQRLKTLPDVTVLHASRVESVQSTDEQLSVCIHSRGERRTLHPALLVAADGSSSLIRDHAGIAVDREDYHQSAVLCTVNTERPHLQTAYERFTRHGPIALLPMTGQQAIMVYGVHSDAGQQLLEMPGQEFAARLQRAFGLRLGRIQLHGERSLWPLRYVHARRQWMNRLVLLGSAAHSIHPNAAQGLNLCLRDAATLAEILSAAYQQGQITSPEVLQRYAAARRHDQKRTIGFNRMICRLFYSSRLSARALRNAIMLFLGHSHLAQDALVSRLSGLHGRQARLVRGE